MNEEERWIYLEGPPPEHVTTLLQALRGDLMPHTPADQERVSRRFFATLSARTGRAVPPSVVARGGHPPPVALPATEPRPSGSATAEALFTAGSQAAPDAGALQAPVTMAPQAVPNPGAGAPPDDRRTALEKLLGISLGHSAPPGLLGTAATPPGGPAAEKWPFGLPPPPPPIPPAPVRPAVKTMQTPVVPNKLGQTADLGGTLQKMVAAVPFDGSSTGAGAVPFPNLSTLEYCQYSAELVAYPTHVAVIRTRYRVLSDASHAALDAHWRQHFADNPEEWPKAREYTARYAAWLRSLER